MRQLVDRSHLSAVREIYERAQFHSAWKGRCRENVQVQAESHVLMSE